MVKVNPNILRWARETAGFSLEEACKKLQIKDLLKISAVERLKNLEAGDITPTRGMLIKMAKLYHRPLIVFYMSAPPRKGNRGQDFRTLPTEYSVKSGALVDALLRNILSRQSIIRAGMEDEEGVEILPFVKSATINIGIPELVESINKTLKFNLEIFRNKTTPQEAFGYLRSCAEKIGIFVLLISDLGSHHTKIGLESFRGFALADEIAPFIVINDQDSKAAWSFTLFHEITHIWLGQTGVSNINFEKEIEKFCNDVASEFLFPNHELSQLNLAVRLDQEEVIRQISDFAYKRNISSSLVAYKLFRAGVIHRETWIKVNNAYQSMWNIAKENQRIKKRGKKGGPDYYILHRYMVGMNLVSTVKRMMADGILTTSKAGKILGVKAKNVQKLMDANGSSKAPRYS